MTLVVGALGTFVACTVGGLVGFASSLILLPVLLLLGVPLWEAVSINLVLAVMTRLPSLVRLRAEVNRRRTATMLAGSVPGILVGVCVAAVVPTAALEVAAATLVVASGCVLLRGPAHNRGSGGGRRDALLAGGLGGALGVTTSLNGVPPAVYLARTGDSVRTRLADLSAFFVVGNCLVLVAIILTRGALALPDLGTSVTWMAAGMAGNGAGLLVASRLDQIQFDRITIGLVLASGVASLVGAVV